MPPRQIVVPKERWNVGKEAVIIRDLISSLLEKGAIEACENCSGQFLSDIFAVQKSGGGFRLVLNLKKLNEFVITTHFKLEDRRTAINLVSENCFLATIDLKDAYYAVPIAEEHRKFLRFRFSGGLYEFTCLPFGLASAPYVFTKILKPVMAELRSRGFLSVIYLDDILVIGNSMENCKENLCMTRNLIEKLGFIINEKKSQITPSKRCKYLGFWFDSERMQLELPENKKIKLKDIIEKFRRAKKCKIRDFARLVGSLVSSCPAIPYGVAHTKIFERERYLALLDSGECFDKYMSINHGLQAEFSWWLKAIESPKNSIRSLKFGMEIFSDASLTGWGVVCGCERSHGFWNDDERRCHINILELKAAYFGLKCFASKIKDEDILLRLDSTTAIAYINRMGGTRFEKLNSMAKKIWEWCEVRNIRIMASFIGTKENAEADFESRRLYMETEFSLASWAFRNISKRLGKPQIDLFASRVNAKCKRFVSWFRDPESSATDSFTIQWSDFAIAYAFPPFSVIPRVLRKMREEGATRTASSIVGEPYPGGRSVIRRAFQLRRVPEEALDLISASLRTSSQKQYDCALRKWWDFCKERNVDIYTPSIEDILAILAIEFQKGAAYGSLNSLRSAISLIVGPFVGQDPPVKRLFKGIAEKRPTRPKYDFTWDPKIVLDYLESLGNNSVLSMEVLTEKLVMLLALVTGQRMQALSLIKISNISRTGNVLQIRIPDTVKTSGRCRSQPLLTFPRCEDRRRVCVVTTLELYIERTSSIRNGEDSLFLGLKRPYKKVSSQTFARWVKKTLVKSGIDTAIFSAHSTRHASSSAAMRKGLEWDTIRKSTGWSKESQTFARFYNLPISTSSVAYARAILED
ncbi:uncharacterized protein [Venturia canescens]|uniref:uncharacterized protein n=1 Tax=Venturia canescens TaxID=32260 RepID=UPI001C9CC75D|nr:uncharacterized protein LOC122408036 [Venturia canescens]